MRSDGVPQVRVNMKFLTPFEVIQQIGATVDDAFVKLDLNHEGRLDVETMSKAISGVGYLFNGEQISQVIAEIDKDGDGYVTRQEFKRSFSPAYGSSAIWSAFDDSRSNNSEQLSLPELHKALVHLGIKGIAEIYTDRLPKLLGTAGVSLTFYTLCRLVSPACLTVHKKSLPAMEPPASWNEIVRCSHFMIGALVGGVLGFVPKPTSSTSTAQAPASAPLAFVYQPIKSLEGRWFDVLTCAFLVGWAGSFLVSLCERNTFRGRMTDCVSLACGMVFFGLILSTVNNGFLGLYIMVCIVFAIFLAKLSKK